MRTLSRCVALRGAAIASETADSTRDPMAEHPRPAHAGLRSCEIRLPSNRPRRDERNPRQALLSHDRCEVKKRRERKTERERSERQEDMTRHFSSTDAYIVATKYLTTSAQSFPNHSQFITMGCTDDHTLKGVLRFSVCSTVNSCNQTPFHWLHG